MNNPRLMRIEAGYLAGKRPRNAGSNARLPVHGIDVRESFARLHFEDGSSGFGFSRVTADQAQALLGQNLVSLISLENGTTAHAASINFPLWDVLGQRAGKPLYQLLARSGFDSDAPFTVPCYATGLYFDDLHLKEDKAAVELIASEARTDYERGHKAFKLKVGRGALHMPLMEGTQRDIAIIRGVREAVGAGLPLMIDANNGYNLNLTKWVLSETADCDVYWMEEPFHEDRVLYKHLHEWLAEQHLSVLIADGEGQASPSLMDWAQAGVVDVIQYDLRDCGLDDWLQKARQLDAWGVKTAPHNYGSAFGGFASCQVASALEHFTFVEWDQIDLIGLDTSDYAIQEGRIHVPTTAGFGLRLDNTVFEKSVKAEGFSVS